MKRYILILVATVLVGLLAAAPVVTNVMAAQSGNLVVISYRLAHPDNLPCEVSLQVSNDGGDTYTIFPASLCDIFWGICIDLCRCGAHGEGIHQSGI